jgi:predicted RNA-binding Zn-ribbon protein involved in translation (DUF1610 family)
MDSQQSESVKPGKSYDGAYGFSFAIGIGLILFIAGLVITLTLGEGTSLGLVFGIPLLLAGLVMPLIMMRGLFTQNEIRDVCPYCSAPIRTSDATIKLQCPTCKREVVVRDMKLCRAQEVTLG